MLAHVLDTLTFLSKYIVVQEGFILPSRRTRMFPIYQVTEYNEGTEHQCEMIDSICDDDIDVCGSSYMIFLMGSMESKMSTVCVSEIMRRYHMKR
jgi:hypothetical protein